MSVLCGGIVATSKNRMKTVKKSTSTRWTSVRPPTSDKADGSGTCPVCGGRVMEKFDVKEDGPRHSMQSAGLHCVRCGIKFEFIPPDGIVLRHR